MCSDHRATLRSPRPLSLRSTPVASRLRSGRLLPTAEVQCPISLRSHGRGLRQDGGRVDDAVRGGGGYAASFSWLGPLGRCRQSSGGDATPAASQALLAQAGRGAVPPAIDRARRPLRFGRLAAYPAEPALCKGRCAPLSRFHPVTRAEPAGCVGARSDGRYGIRCQEAIFVRFTLNRSISKAQANGVRDEAARPCSHRRLPPQGSPLRSDGSAALRGLDPAAPRCPTPGGGSVPIFIPAQGMHRSWRSPASPFTLLRSQPPVRQSSGHRSLQPRRCATACAPPHSAPPSSACPLPAAARRTV